MEDLHTSDPRIIGRYRILARIGTGGMGFVYLAEGDPGQEVALKLVRPELVGDRGFRARFRREVEAAQRVGGICTARYLDADLESEHPYLVTEYVEGGNLFDHVRAHGPLSGERLIGLAVGLAEALVAISAVGVIHRDLKPSNVLMAPSGPKVVDFGISRAIEETAITQSGNIIGSPGWMAPEQALGHATTAAIDVFSWGATVAFASTGRAPFGEGRPDAVLYRVVHEESDLDGLDPKLEKLVSRALRKDPAQRPSADQLLLELVKTAMAGALPPGGSIAMATVVLDRTWHQGSAHAVRTRQKRGGARRWIPVAAFVLLACLIGLGVLALTHSNQKAPAAATSGKTSTVPSNAATSSSSPPTTTANGSQSPTAVVSADIPTVVCPTTFGLSPTSTVVIPPTTSESVPGTLAEQLAVYTTQDGSMKVLGPTGWTCTATVGADGSTKVGVYPPGQGDPNSQPFQTSSAQAVLGSQSGGCEGCAVTQASPLFVTAASDCAAQFQGNVCSTKPSAESVEQIGNGVVGFLDPPGVAGSGNPSGGPYPANGVMTYHTSNFTRSYVDTCTLPSSDHALCTAILNNFVQSYGNA